MMYDRCSGDAFSGALKQRGNHVETGIETKAEITESMHPLHHSRYDYSIGGNLSAQAFFCGQQILIRYPFFVARFVLVHLSTHVSKTNAESLAQHLRLHYQAFLPRLNNFFPERVPSQPFS